MTTSKPLFVYLQRPDNGEWVTVGRYLLDGDKATGTFKYAPSYERAGLSWSIDPVNLPFVPGQEWEARRYGGLHDVLRDASPDAWGKLLIQREHNLPAHVHESRYLALSSNADRWGALAVGTSPKPAIAHLATPRLPQLEALTLELQAMFERRPPIDARLRKRLVATPSLGGARPKATVRDGEHFWLVKPSLPTSDVEDIPLLEHFAQQWGRASGLRFAETVHHPLGESLSVVRVLRFDRHGDRRVMAVSAASLLQTEYPGATHAETERWSYPRLAEELKRIGAPVEDRHELFGRMVFNAIVGNDDDHPRNHAVIYSWEEKRWRLSPAFDVVPNPLDRPRHLALQLSKGHFEISRASMLADAVRFGFDGQLEAATHLDETMDRIEQAFAGLAPMLSTKLRGLMTERLQDNLAILR